MNVFNLKKQQRGQTLLETVVGIFIMVMGISASMSLVTFSLNSTRQVVSQLVGMGLAREGIEAVKNMRDTNWLKGNLDGDGCYQFPGGPSNSAPCYTDWQNSFYDIQTNPGQKTYALDINPTAVDGARFWLFNNENSRFALNFDSTGNSGRFYYPAGSVTGNSGYYRKIITREESPYTNDPSMRRLLVTSQVWWVDKGCPPSTDFPGNSKCGVELTAYLTNWRNY